MASISPRRKRVFVRPAWPDEGPVLSALALEAKAHWGYDTAFMERCRAELTVTEARIWRERIRVADVNGKVAGFASLTVGVGRADIGDVFVRPRFIGTGIGHLLINDLLQYACRHGISLINVEADPNATGFYARQGFSVCGEAPSGSIPDRMLPLMEMRF